MWLPKFAQLLFTAVLLSTQVIAGDRQVTRARELGLYIPQDTQYSWKEVKETEGFVASVFVSKSLKYIEVQTMENPTNDFKSYEALLSIWEHQTKLTIGSLNKIKYNQVNGPDKIIINTALEKLGYSLSGRKSITSDKISRDSSDHAEVWNLLSTASFGKDAVEICTEFKDMSNRYIQSFEIGRNCDFDKWVEITFATKVE
ncbi:hypothetical protein HOO65_070630 [Ceratocystis lukuohia]|uniref:Secreted protein n=1 Tax=Ceratocystis lukuohia TaxID=2019550 RepID=A0ABR4MD60_9PEZI